MECPFCVGADGSYTTLGHNMFFTLQTVYTKGERRLAVK